MKRQVLCGAVLAIAGTAAASVFDDARLWWKFDNGGADGAVVQKSEIHDARDPSAAVPTAVYGAQGGPLWSRMDVRLPTQRKTVNCTALYAPRSSLASCSTATTWGRRTASFSTTDTTGLPCSARRSASSRVPR